MPLFFLAIFLELIRRKGGGSLVCLDTDNKRSCGGSVIDFYKSPAATVTVDDFLYQGQGWTHEQFEGRKTHGYNKY